MNNKKKKRMTAVNYMRTAISVSAAIAVILAALSFIVYKIVSAYNYNERWKDYNECGLS